MKATCKGCGKEIDPDVCHCGSTVEDHPWSPHEFVPMGCDCQRMSAADEAEREDAALAEAELWHDWMMRQ